MMAAAAAARARAQAIPEVEPAYTLNYGPGAWAVSAQLSPDGSTLYVQVREEGINIWAMLASLWPEILGGLAALITLVLAIMLLRRLRSPQEIGAPYCRACGYNLRGYASQVQRPDTAPSGCPECGVNLIRRPPRPGRSMVRRTWRLGVLAAAVALGYAAMHVAGLPRVGRAAEWLHWRWPALEKYAEEKSWTWVQAFRADYDRLWALDAATGAVKRPLRTIPGTSQIPMAISPDGRTLVAGQGDRGLIAVDAATGRCIRRHRAPAVATRWWFRYDHIAGFSGDSTTVYATRIDEPDWFERLIAWNYATGEVETLISRPAARIDVAQRGTIPACRRYRHVPGPDPPSFLSVPGFLEAYHRKHYDVQLHRGVVPRNLVDLGDRYTMQAPVIDARGRRFFISAMHEGVDGYDLRTGESLGTVTAIQMFDTGWPDLAISPDGRFLFMATVTTDSILVRDLEARRWAFRLRCGKMLNPAVCTSADGGRIAAVSHVTAGTGGIGGSIVRVFDLPAAGATPEPPPGGAPGVE